MVWVQSWWDDFTDTNLAGRYDYIEQSGGGTTGVVEVLNNQLHVNVTTINPHYSYIDQFVIAKDIRWTADIKTVKFNTVDDFGWFNINNTQLSGSIAGLSWKHTGNYGWYAVQNDGTITSGTFSGTDNTFARWIIEYHSSPHTFTITVDGVQKLNYVDATSGSQNEKVADWNFSVVNDDSNDNRGDLYVDNLMVELNPTFEFEGFRFRNDDGNETTATWRQIQDTNDSVSLSTLIRFRALINTDNSDPPSINYSLQWRKSGAGDNAWRDVKS